MGRFIRMLAVAGVVGSVLSACVVAPPGGYYARGRPHVHGGYGHGHGHGYGHGHGHGYGHRYDHGYGYRR